MNLKRPNKEWPPELTPERLAMLKASEEEIKRQERIKKSKKFI